jgi:hypothetical protein
MQSTQWYPDYLWSYETFVLSELVNSETLLTFMGS